MAKRFTDSDKWVKPWFRKLTPAQKCFWFYLLDRCDFVGIWEVDFELAEIFIGTKIDPAFLEPFEKQYTPIDDGKRWFISDFINFQYGELKANVSTHKNVILKLKRLGLYDTLMEGLDNPCQRVKDKDTDKDTDKDKDKDKDTEKYTPPSPEPNDQLTPEWQLYAKACACFGSSPDNFITDGRKRYLRLIRGDVRVGADLFIRACENRARAQDVPGKISPDYFFCDQWQERITEWAKGPPKYGSFKDSEKPNKKRNADIAMEWLRDQQGQS
jgi:hypothetical protein